jgi:hypothetical protein
MAATVARPPIRSTHTGRAPAIMLGLAMLVGLGFVAGFAFPYFAGGEALASIVARKRGSSCTSAAA